MIDFIREITSEAGEAILKLRTVVIRGEKEGQGNVVTEADLTSEQVLMRAIRKSFPGHLILSEETPLEQQELAKADHLWVIDPLDGTNNNRFGLPLFSISVAYLEKGIVRAGGIYDASRKELFWAKKGEGAYCNDQQIRVYDQQDFDGALVNVGCPYKIENFQRTYPVGKVLHSQGARLVNLGSAALECAYVASGRLALFYEVGLKPWDVAAADLIIKEAGGVIDSLSQPFSIFQPDEVIAGNFQLVEKAKGFIKITLINTPGLE